MDFLYILETILFTVYGMLVMNWQVNGVGAFPAEGTERMKFFLGLVFNPWIISCFAAGFLAALSWMVALSKFELSFAYPFTSLSFALVLGLSALFFGEAFTLAKVLGFALILCGIIIGSRG